MEMIRAVLLIVGLGFVLIGNVATIWMSRLMTQRFQTTVDELRDRVDRLEELRRIYLARKELS